MHLVFIYLLRCIPAIYRPIQLPGHSPNNSILPEGMFNASPADLPAVVPSSQALNLAQAIWVDPLRS